MIGITGGIGSGKTTVCRIFETLGIPVYYADERAKWLMMHRLALRKMLRSQFGKQAFTPAGALNRAYIASMVFNDPDKLNLLNESVHPFVFRDSLNWHRQQRHVPYTLKEAALLFESGSYRHLDKVITVTAPLEIRIARVMERDQTSREAVLARIARQQPEELKAAKSDFVIVNDGQQSLIRQVLHIHKQLI